MMRIMFRKADGSIDASLGTESIPSALADSQGLLWVDFVNEPDESCERILREVFRFHPLAIDDALRESHVPKVDDWESYLYIVLHAVSFDPAADQQLATLELDIFAGSNYIVTHHEQAIDPLDRVWADCPRDERVMGKGAARLLYHLVTRSWPGTCPQWMQSTRKWSASRS